MRTGVIVVLLCAGCVANVSSADHVAIAANEDSGNDASFIDAGNDAIALNDWDSSGSACFPIGATYLVVLDILPLSTCGPLFPHYMQLQSNGGIIVAGSACTDMDASGCTFSNSGCMMQGDDFMCTLIGKATFNANGAVGTGEVNIVCIKKRCVDNYCMLMSILGGNQTCTSYYVVTLTRMKEDPK